MLFVDDLMLSSMLFPVTGIILGIILLVNGVQDKAKKVLAAFFFLSSLGMVFGTIYNIISPIEEHQLLDPVVVLAVAILYTDIYPGFRKNETVLMV